jgi:diaminopimelate epimerase
VDFVKVQALGNDFLVFDSPDQPSSDQIVAWCDRRRGIGADGVLVIAPLGDDVVRMRYWNADGGEAEMCGNGLRCIAKLAHQRGWVDHRTFRVETAVGLHPVEVGEDVVKAFVGVPRRYRTETLSVAGQDVYPLSIGNPHAVVIVDDVDTAPVETVGPIIERDPLFPDRTNVEFVEMQLVDVEPTDSSDPDEFADLRVGETAESSETPNTKALGNSIRARIWERGVGETEASGTGAAAAAFVAHEVKGVPAPVTVVLRGGDLVVSFNEAGAWMEGPAEIVFSGSVG